MNTRNLLKLAELPIGHSALIVHLHTRPEVGSRLRELGFYRNAVIRCITRGNGGIICEVCNTRIGLDRNLAGSIVVSIFKS